MIYNHYVETQVEYNRRIDSFSRIIEVNSAIEAHSTDSNYSILYSHTVSCAKYLDSICAQINVNKDEPDAYIIELKGASESYMCITECFNLAKSYTKNERARIDIDSIHNNLISKNDTTALIWGQGIFYNTSKMAAKLNLLGLQLELWHILALATLE